MRSIVALVSIALSAAPAMADEPIVLTSSTAWQLEYAENKCRLSRVFGEDGNRSVFIIDKDSPGKLLSWIVASPSLVRFRQDRESASQFGPTFEPVVKNATPLLFKGYGQAFMSEGYRPMKDHADVTSSGLAKTEAPETLGEVGKHIEWFQISQGKRTVRFDLGGMGAPFAALANCADDLMISWGLDPRELEAVHTPAGMVNMEEFAQKVQRRYPATAGERGLGAIFNMKIVVDEQGKIVWCKMFAQTKAEGFDDAACAIAMEDLILEPARDKDGKPVKSLLNSKITYFSK
ncbi:hypothetical protein [uncultured Croceicoccus sp.]|uniref:hypothetical protein n=1 Tax=uncultured Croceicoccus sp. TaxID=1295329 RepID=UPI00261A64E6|nr:hypothetical protein [uncultured Croceicoccus sp.]